MMERYTIKQLRDLLNKLPDDGLVCCQSDEEGNRTMVVMDAFVERVGRKTSENFDGKWFEFIDGQDIEGIDLKDDNGKVLVVIRPMY